MVAVQVRLASGSGLVERGESVEEGVDDGRCDDVAEDEHTGRNGGAGMDLNLRSGVEHDGSVICRAGVRLVPGWIHGAVIWVMKT
jgi:hypothetical protein